MCLCPNLLLAQFYLFFHKYAMNGTIWQIKSGVLDITVGVMSKVVHLNGENSSFQNIILTQIVIDKCIKFVNESLNSFFV